MAANWEECMLWWPAGQPTFMHNDKTTTTSPDLRLRIHVSDLHHCFVLRTTGGSPPAQVNHCCTSRSTTVYALLHDSLIMMLLPHAHTQLSAIIISQGHSWRGVMRWAWSELIESQFLNCLNWDLLSNSGGGAAPDTGLWEKYISSNTAVLAYCDAGEFHRRGRCVFYPVCWTNYDFSSG